MKTQHWIFLVAAFLLAACEDSAPQYDQGARLGQDPGVLGAFNLAPGGDIDPQDSYVFDDVEPVLSEAQPETAETTPTSEPGSLIAYRHEMRLRFPPDTLVAGMQSHLAICEAAGQQVCQVLSTTVRQADSDYVNAMLRLRADPGWLEDFRVQTITDAQSAGGSLASAQSFSDDLTAQIIDVEARLEAQVALRDRLMELLQTEQANLADLIALERQLSEVQADLDARASVLAALRQRVDMSNLTLRYSPLRPDQLANPVARALSDSGYIFMDSLGTLIGFLIAVGPWLIIILPGLWYGVRFVGRAWRARKV